MMFYDFQVDCNNDILLHQRYYADNAVYAFCLFLADMLDNSKDILADRLDINSADYAERIFNLFLAKCYSIEDELGDTICIDFDI